jgi:hypothetical protein
VAGIVPWIKAADPAKEFLQAYQTSAQIAQANARMAQSAAQADREYALQQQAMQQRQERQQRQDEQDAQQLEVTKAYREQQMQLGQQKLAQAKQDNDQKIQQSAQAAGRQMQLQKAADAINDDYKSGLIDEKEKNARYTTLAVQSSISSGKGIPQTIKSFAEAPDIQPKIFEDPVSKARFPYNPATGAFKNESTIKTGQITPSQASAILQKDPPGLTDEDKQSLLNIVRQGVPKTAFPKPRPPTTPTSTGTEGPGLWDRMKGVFAPDSLQAAYDAKRRAATATGAAPTATGTAPPQITTKEQYDALEPGTIYIGKGGKRYRKPVDEKPVQESSRDD